MPEGLLKFWKYFLILAFFGLLVYSVYERLIPERSSNSIFVITIPLLLLFISNYKFFMSVRVYLGLVGLVCIAPFMVYDFWTDAEGLDWIEILIILVLLIFCYLILDDVIRKVWKKKKA